MYLYIYIYYNMYIYRIEINTNDYVKYKLTMRIKKLNYSLWFWWFLVKVVKIRIAEIEVNRGMDSRDVLYFCWLELAYQPNHQNFIFVQEPVNQWLKLTDEKGVNILDNFYKDKIRWGYSFQMNAFITRVKSIYNLNRDDNIMNYCPVLLYVILLLFKCTSHEILKYYKIYLAQKGWCIDSSPKKCGLWTRSSLTIYGI